MHGPLRGHGGVKVAKDVWGCQCPPRGEWEEEEENPRERRELCRQQTYVARAAGTSTAWSPLGAAGSRAGLGGYV